MGQRSGKVVQIRENSYPEVDIEMTALSDLEGDVEVIALVKRLKEASALLSGDDDVECGRRLDRGHEGDGEDGELAEHGKKDDKGEGRDEGENERVPSRVQRKKKATRLIIIIIIIIMHQPSPRQPLSLAHALIHSDHVPRKCLGT